MSEDIMQKILTKLVEIDSKNNKEFTDIRNQFTELNQKVDGIAEQVRINAEGISAINDKLEKVDSTIDILARRSIDQEAALKRIK